jgi:DegV family protein with EDD domain
MRRVRIVTDSTADVPASYTSELGIAVVPCQIYFGDDTYQDGVDLTPQQLFGKMAGSRELPRTAQPPIGRFVKTYEGLLAEEPDTGIVSIHVAARLSGTLNAAWAAAQRLPDPSQVKVIDSGQVSLGMGWVVIEAARLAKTGATLAEISQAAEEMLPRVRTVAMIDTLENLYKGGRISQISATLGSVLQIKPLVRIADGEVTVWGKVRTHSRALKRLAEEVRSWGPLAEMAILHTGAKELAQALAEQLQEVSPASGMLAMPAGAALSVHLGLGVVGVCALVTGDGQ